MTALVLVRSLLRFTMRTHQSKPVTVSAKDFSHGAKCYEEAVETLNTLQTNAAYLEKVRQERDKNRHLQCQEMISMASRAGITPELLDTLSVIHVSGTKGKGSTCAFTESILRERGFKTGFYSSPHLVEVRERIQINGTPLAKEKFACYFWECYDRLDATKEENEGKMPQYFKFLTIMAFHVFLSEKVDVAIMEVGIGGEYDSTNIVRTPVVCGVTSLGYDHMNILGSTIESIAWHKAGIFKESVPALTVEQPPGALQVLKERAHERQCPLYLVTADIQQGDGCIHSCMDGVSLGIAGKMQHHNACLAVKLSQIWLQNHCLDIQRRLAKYENCPNGDISILPFEPLTPAEMSGLANCSWPGRTQVVKKDGFTFYIDGAHTVESVECCVDWFEEQSQLQAINLQKPLVKVLLFNITGDRSPESLLQLLVPCNFDCVIFCPNVVSGLGKKTDQCNYTVTLDNQLARCHQSHEAWRSLWQKHNEQNQQTTSVENTIPMAEQLSSCHEIAAVHNSASLQSLTSGDNNESTTDCRTGVVFPAITDALDWLKAQYSSETLQENSISELSTQKKQCNQTVENLQGDQNLLKVDFCQILTEAKHFQVLCTGSLHLVGNVLGVLSSNNNKSNC